MHTTKTSAPSHDERWRAIDARMLRLGHQPDALIEVLHEVQQAFGYIDQAALRYVATALHVPLSKAYGVATFYSLFRLAPDGRHSCVVCTGTACHISGSDAILTAVEQRLGIRPKQTTPDRRISLDAVRCVGPCSIAPVVVYDGETKGNQTVDGVVAWMEEQ